MIDGRWLWQQQRALVARYAGRLGRPLAEDLASEAAARCLRRPAPDGRHGPWLECIFRNLVADHHRQRVRATPVADPSLCPAAPPTPEEALLHDERRRLIALAWRAVEPDQRAAIEARIEGDEDRLAARCGLAHETIRTRIHRGLVTLRRAVARLGARMPAWVGSTVHPMAAATLPAVASLVLLIAPPRQPAEPPPAPGRLAQTRTVPARPAAAVPATPAPPTKAPLPAAKARPRRPDDLGAPPTLAPAIKRFDFDTDDVSGDLQRPDGVTLLGPPARLPQVSLIEIPDSFVPAIARSLEDL